MAQNRILQLKQDISGKWEYIPDPDESEIKENIYFLYGLDLALQVSLALDRSIKPGDISMETIIHIIPEWLKDAIYAISVMADLFLTRFMKDGKWVKFKWINVGWNFMSLVMLYRAAKDIVKAFKKPGDDSEST